MSHAYIKTWDNQLMKFFHCADIHLGSKLESNFSPTKAAERASEIRTTFSKLADTAEKEGVTAILLSGDVFDVPLPRLNDTQFFYSVIRNHPHIDFLYLRGNHDTAQVHLDRPDNLKLFDETWTHYSYGDVDIYGREIGDNVPSDLASSLTVDPNRINIVMLHGQAGLVKQKGSIDLREFASKGIDYIALGHIHSYSSGNVDSRCSYAYSGCLEPRGYDELGPKGYIDIEVDKKLALKFVEFSRRRIDLLKVDVSGCHSTVDVIDKIRNESKTSPDNLLRIELVGQADFDKSSLLNDVNSALESSYYSISVKDKTKKKIDIDSYRDEKSIRGEFIRMVEQDSSLSDEEKAKVIELGFDALQHGEEEAKR